MRRVKVFKHQILARVLLALFILNPTLMALETKLTDANLFLYKVYRIKRERLLMPNVLSKRRGSFHLNFKVLLYIIIVSYVCEENNFTWYHAGIYSVIKALLRIYQLSQN